MALPQIRIFFSLLVCLLSMAKTESNVTSAGSATESTKFFWGETLKSGTESGTVTTLTTTSSMIPMTWQANRLPWDNIFEGNKAGSIHEDRHKVEQFHFLWNSSTFCGTASQQCGIAAKKVEQVLWAGLSSMNCGTEGQIEHFKFSRISIIRRKYQLIVFNHKFTWY